jgi:hypothetical protein
MSTNKKPEEHPEAPPSYAVATGSSATSQPTQSSHLEVPAPQAASRKSMEDEARPLPTGWIRQWDTKEHHQFYVDTKADPPRSIWVHPLDDEETWNSLSSEEKERLQAEEAKLQHPDVSTSDGKGSHSDTKGPIDSKSSTSQAPHEHFPTELPPRSSQSQPHVTGQPQKKGFTERLKDKVTGMTHEEREQSRAQRAEEERQYYEMHARFRTALHRAQMTGQPQWFAKDRDGKDIFIEPPAQPGYGGYGGRYGPGGMGYNPYTSGPYSNPNARFVRPNYAYGRPGYGGGLALPVAGGLLGGALLGGLLF